MFLVFTRIRGPLQSRCQHFFSLLSGSNHDGANFKEG